MATPQKKRRVIIVHNDDVSKDVIQNELTEFALDDVDVFIDRREPNKDISPDEQPRKQSAFYAQQINIGYFSTSGGPQTLQSLHGSIQNIERQNVDSTPHINYGNSPSYTTGTRRKTAVKRKKVELQPSLNPVSTAPYPFEAEELEAVNFCDICLPRQKPLVREETCATHKRLYLVCCPASIPEQILTDALCRFGNLIYSYIIPGVVYGYAKFGSIQSADKARVVLHGHTLEGNTLYIYESDPPKPSINEPGPSSA